MTLSLQPLIEHSQSQENRGQKMKASHSKHMRQRHSQRASTGQEISNSISILDAPTAKHIKPQAQTHRNANEGGTSSHIEKQIFFML